MDNKQEGGSVMTHLSCDLLLLLWLNLSVIHLLLLYRTMTKPAFDLVQVNTVSKEQVESLRRVVHDVSSSFQIGTFQSRN